MTTSGRLLGLVTLVALALQACPSDPSGSAGGSVGGAPEGGGDGDAGHEPIASGGSGAPSGRSGAPSGQGGEGGRAEPHGPCDGCPCNLCGDGDLSADGQLCAEEGKLCGSCLEDCAWMVCQNARWDYATRPDTCGSIGGSGGLGGGAGAGGDGGGGVSAAGNGGAGGEGYEPGSCELVQPSELPSCSEAAQDDDCRSCLKLNCCEDYQLCFGESPTLACGSGELASGAGQFECIRACFVANQGGVLDPDDLLQSCAEGCVQQCEWPDEATNGLIVCANDVSTCQASCFPFD